MDESAEISMNAKEIHKNMTEELDQKINEWKDIMARLMKTRFDSTHKFVNHVTENLQKRLPSEALEMPAEDFIEKYINASSIKDESTHDIGNQTIAAIDQLNYILNSSRHDDDAKEAASKLQQVLLANK